MNALVTIPQSNVDAYRASTDAAGLCREIVLASAMSIQGRKYVRVEGWQAIAIAHGCTGSAREVERVEGGIRAIGEVRRMSDGTVIAEAEGFVGEDEPTWFGGKSGSKTLPKRPDYAIRAMAQTRAISRACRSAFAHVVVMMNAGLSTTPAEEVPDGGFEHERIQDAKFEPVAPRTQPRRAPDAPIVDAPPADKPVDRSADVVPAPEGDDKGDWEAWRKVIAKKISRAATEAQVDAIQSAHAQAIVACAKLLPDTLDKLAGFVSAKKAQLAQIASADAEEAAFVAEVREHYPDAEVVS